PFAADLAALETISSALASIAENVADFLDKTASFDESKVDELISKLDKIDRLKKKYGATIEYIIEYRDRTSAQLEALKTGEETKTDLENELFAQIKKLKTAAAALSKKRKAASERFVGKVEAELQTLGLPKAVFSVNIIPIEAEPQKWPPHGSEDIEFMFSANPGERPRPLADIISGGEMSRFMLAIKTVGAASSDSSGIMIFDEIDAGLSGPAGQTVGAKLCSLASFNQIIAITHLPQIAAFASRHFFVEKSESAGRTLMRVRRLVSEEIRPEMARMLSGRKITDTALRHADELIRQAKTVPPSK
ncbi:MAG: DNA repair protein RecN, partial [Endomicrobiia bacterium]|nr:DNA repair protein RecN [Endomicrobiia bacterium]